MMTKRAFTMRLVLFESLGFALLILLVWLDEVLDLPHRLMGAPATPINWRESLMETLLVVLFGALACVWTQRAVKHIRYLEGILHICCYCKRICVDKRWMALEAYISSRSDAMFSHGICPDCLREHEADLNGPPASMGAGS
jgi:hypothetical protein